MGIPFEFELEAQMAYQETVVEGVLPFLAKEVEGEDLHPEAVAEGEAEAHQT